MAQFNNKKLAAQYDSILSQLQGSNGYTPMSMPEQSLQSITDQLAEVYRPQYEKAILQRYGATKQQKAAIDVDAASRGMGTSTWVTDAKNRLMNAEAADISGLESDYASQLAGDALQQYNNYLANKQQLDQYNQQLALALEGQAYNRAMDQYGRGMIEGTLPYQQLMFQWNKTQNSGSGGGKKSGTVGDMSLEGLLKAFDELYGNKGGTSVPDIYQTRDASAAALDPAYRRQNPANGQWIPETNYDGIIPKKW